MKINRQQRKKRKISNGRRKTIIQERGRYLRQLIYEPENLPRSIAYNLPAVSIDNNASPTTETKRQAEIIFQRIRKASQFKTSKITDKRKHLENILHACKKAMHYNGTIMNPRNYAHPDFSKIRQQIIECLIEKAYLVEAVSPPGSPKISRLFPTRKLRKYAKRDPWAFDPNTIKQYVFLSKRNDKTEIVFDLEKLPKGHIAVETQRRLELINQVNSQYEIIYHHFCPYERDFTIWNQIRPIHYAKFTERWDLHGRIYTGKYGHQSLSKLERRTILFCNCQSVELDYSGMHTRLLYHISRKEFRDDPYFLWGKKTSPEQRLLAKTCINIALNARTRKAAISQSNNEMNSWTKEKKKKTGDSLYKALQLYHTYKKVELTFGQIYDLALKRHKPIAKYFGSDAGIWLMRIYRR